MKANVRPASEDQFDELRIGVVRAFDKLRGRLDNNVAQGWIGNSSALDRLMEGLLPPEKSVPAEPATPESILELINDRIVVPATTTRFIARERFVLDTSDEAKVKISYLDDNSEPWFLEGASKIEDPFTGSRLRCGKLRQSSVDGPILTELGGNDKAETTLTEVFSLMEKQPKGEDGVLLNNGWANIFYVRDQNNVLRAVRVSWFDVGWRVFADSVEYPDGWSGGSLVFSRNSVLDPSATSAPAQA